MVKKKTKKSLNSISNLIWKYLGECNATELKRIISDCENATKTNCFWVDYQLRKVVSEIAIIILSRKSKTANKKSWAEKPDKRD